MSTASPPQRDRSEVEAQRRQLRRVAHLLDDSIRIPGTDRRFGWEPVISLVPGIGDAAGLALSTAVIVGAIHLGARGGTVARMVLNASVDAVVGSIPIIGWAFDFAFKANQRNVALLEAHVSDPEGTEARSRTAVRRTIIAAIVAVVLVSIALVALVAWVLTLIF
ncbi:MAG TPA: DUF4112 domain-containing protein [Acidimicrobiales bacterium]|nr:DUF4112 domain-containing protein [Acidimicrobiales bacterium]